MTDTAVEKREKRGLPLTRWRFTLVSDILAEDDPGGTIGGYENFCDKTLHSSILYILLSTVRVVAVSQQT